MPDNYLLVKGANGYTVKVKLVELADGTFAVKSDAQLTGSTVDLRGLAANKPAANTVVVGTTYWSVDTGAIEVSDGTVWRAV